MKVGLFVTNQQHARDRHGQRAGRPDTHGPSGARPRLELALSRASTTSTRATTSSCRPVPFLARLAAEAGEMTLGLRHPAAQPAQPRLHGRDGGHARRHRPRQLHLRRRPGLPRRGVRRLRRAQGRAGQALRGVPDARAAPVDGGERLLRGPRLPPRQGAHEHPPRAEAAAADLDGGQQRPGRQARGPHGGRLVHQSARHHRHHPPPDGDLPRGAEGGRQGRAARAAADQGGLLRARPGDRARDGADPTCSRSTATMPSGARTRSCPTTPTSTARSRS